MVVGAACISSLWGHSGITFALAGGSPSGCGRIRAGGEDIVSMRTFTYKLFSSAPTMAHKISETKSSFHLK